MENTHIIAKLSEYLSIAPYLSESSPPELYRRANQLALELAVWLPAELYRHLGQSIANPWATCNPGSVIVAARKHFTDNDVLDENLIIHHAPGIGRKEKP